MTTDPPPPQKKKNYFQVVVCNTKTSNKKKCRGELMHTELMERGGGRGAAARDVSFEKFRFRLLTFFKTEISKIF
jgi:hypothetical protein